MPTEPSVQLSPNFTLAELTRSETATAKNISNQPGPEHLANLQALCTQLLQPLRDALGTGLKINSGYRSAALNAAIPGSSKTSQHLLGQAADIVCPQMPVLDLFKRIIELGLPFDQIIYEARSPSSKWVHVSYDSARTRGDIRVAKFFPDGKIAYNPVTREQALAMSEPLPRGGFAIGMMEYVEVHDEPPEAVKAPAKKAAAKKAPAKKAAAKKAPAKKAPAKKVPAKKAAAKKAPAKKAPAKKAPAKKKASARR